MLSSLTIFSLEFESPQSRPEGETRRPPPKRSVVPALTSLHFKGVVEYLEDLVVGISAPRLDDMEITFFNQINFDTRRLARFINRAPKLGKRDATVLFNDDFASVGLSPGTFQITISCKEPDSQLSSIEQLCNSFLHPLSTVEDLYIELHYSQLVWKDDAIENTLWLQILLPFTAVINLYIDKEFAPGIAAALQELDGARVTEVLPSLQNIFVKGLARPFWSVFRLGESTVQEKFGQFIAARRLSNHTIAISDWDGCRMESK